MSAFGKIDPHFRIWLLKRPSCGPLEKLYAKIEPFFFQTDLLSDHTKKHIFTDGPLKVSYRNLSYLLFSLLTHQFFFKLSSLYPYLLLISSPPLLLSLSNSSLPETLSSLSPRRMAAEAGERPVR